MTGKHWSISKHGKNDWSPKPSKPNDTSNCNKNSRNKLDRRRHGAIWAYSLSLAAFNPTVQAAESSCVAGLKKSQSRCTRLRTYMPSILRLKGSRRWREWGAIATWQDRDGQ